MGLFGKSKKENIPTDTSKYASFINYIKIDLIDDKPLDNFFWKYGDKKKGLFAKKTEIIYLESGEHTIFAHGATYQTTSTSIKVSVEAGKNYILGAGILNDDTEGLYFEER